MEIKVHDDRTFKEKARDKLIEAQDKFHDAEMKIGKWIGENPERAVGVMLAIGGVICGGAKLIKAVRPSAAEIHERRMDRTYYDPSTGMHWDLKRNLTNAERCEIMSRKRDGEYTEDILRDMKLMKK